MNDKTKADDAVEQADTKASPVERLVMPDFGQKVRISKKYVRKSWRHEKRGVWKYWESLPYAVSDCVFLGTRTLQNGTREYEHDEGYTFDCHERFIAALVSPGERLNPVLVPLDAIEA